MDQQESDPLVLTKTDSDAARISKPKPPVPRKPPVSQKCSFTKSPGTSSPKDGNNKPAKTPPPLPKTSPNSHGLRISPPPQSTAQLCTKSHEDRNQTSEKIKCTKTPVGTNHAPEFITPALKVNHSTTATADRSQDQSNSLTDVQLQTFTDQSKPSLLSQSSPDINLTASSDNMTNISTSDSKSPKPRIPRTQSNTSINKTKNPVSSKENSPKHKQESTKEDYSQSIFYTEDFEENTGQSSFYIDSNSSGKLESKLNISDNEKIIPESTVSPIKPQPRLSITSVKTKKTPPKVPPKISPKSYTQHIEGKQDKSQEFDLKENQTQNLIQEKQDMNVSANVSESNVKGTTSQNLIDSEQHVKADKSPVQPHLNETISPNQTQNKPDPVSNLRIDCSDDTLSGESTEVLLQVVPNTNNNDIVHTTVEKDNSITTNVTDANTLALKVKTKSPIKTPSPRPRPQPKPRKSVSPRSKLEHTSSLKDSGKEQAMSVETSNSVNRLKDNEQSISVTSNSVNISVETVIAEKPEDDEVNKLKSIAAEERDSKKTISVHNNSDDQEVQSEGESSTIINTLCSFSNKSNSVDYDTNLICDKSVFNSGASQNKEESVHNTHEKNELISAEGEHVVFHEDCVDDLEVEKIKVMKSDSGIVIDSVSSSREDLSEKVEGNHTKSGNSKDVGLLDNSPLPETCSLLDEIEKIVTKRMSQLESTSHEQEPIEETAVPVRPPRPNRERKRSLGDLNSVNLDSLQDGAEFKGSTSSVKAEIGVPPPCSKKIQPPKPRRNKIKTVNRSQSDISGSRPQCLELCGHSQSVDISDEESDKKIPVLPPRKSHKNGKARSLTVDFCVPANQHALLREIALADHRRELEFSKSPQDKSGETNRPLQGNKRPLRPSRKAPPPPIKTADTTSSEIKQDLKSQDIKRAKQDNESGSQVVHQNLSRCSSVSESENGDHEYHYIPEDLTEFILTGGKEKTPPPPDLPPRTYSISISSPGHGQHGSFTNLTDKGRPESGISVFSSQSESGSYGHGSPGQDELSSSDSEGENEEDRIVKKKAKKVYLIAREIYSSEKVFVDVLKLLNVDFRFHMSQATEANGKPVIQNEVLNKILNYLPQLQNLNEELLKDLEQRITKWEEFPQISDIFVKLGPFLKLYTSYIKDFSEATEILDEACKRHPTFQASLKQFEMSERCASLALKHYMLKPIQRIPQYKLLLQDYLKHLTHDSPDYDNTLSALNIVTSVADHANESMRQGDHVQKMLEIQKSLDGNYEVIKPGRIFLKEGELMKLSRKEMQPRMFFLFNDVLLYTTPISTGGYKLNNVLTLVGMKVTKPKRDDLKNEFNIISIQRSFMVEARTQEERDDWLSTLQKAIDDHAHRRNTFENGKTGGHSFYEIYDVNYELGSKAPIWIPDTRVTMCMICTSEFSVTWRRHHCRACGRVVCSNCSDNHAPLEYLRNKSVRVCDECFQKLKEAFERKETNAGKNDLFTQDQDGSFLSFGSLKERFRQIRRSARFTHQVTTKRPARLKEHANDPDATMSGYLKIWVSKKWKNRWFVLKEKVLYTFKASEDTLAKQSMPVLGYDIVKCAKVFEGMQPHLLFQLNHQNQHPMVFCCDDEKTKERWMTAMEDASKP